MTDVWDRYCDLPGGCEVSAGRWIPIKIDDNVTIYHAKIELFVIFVTL